jgi:hypothetical protein
MKDRGMSEKYQHIKIDFETVVDAHTKLGGSRYSMILEGALRARDIAKRRTAIDIKTEKLNKYGFKPINQALADMVVDYE